jgi:L-aminopeptidase/D-esterase-like protein
MPRPGPRNLITDVAGLSVGQAEDAAARTGVTVVMCAERRVAAVDVRGGGPGTRETDALDPTGLVASADAVVLSGGSVFGLAAASAVVPWLAARGRGFQVGPARAPIVPSAVLFDFLSGGDKDWGDRPPYHRLALEACEALGADFALGNAGAGMGARAGRLKGGLGSASIVDEETGATVGALVAANPLGSPVMPDGPTLWAWALERDGELGGQPPPTAPAGAAVDFDLTLGMAQAGTDGAAAPGGATVIGAVATDADLAPPEAKRLAIMAHDGIARAVRPSHTPFDGDTVFVLAGGATPLSEPRALALARLGSLAADVFARALARGVYEAESLGIWPGYRSLHGHALRARP